MTITIFTVPGCPRCEAVKNHLRAQGHSFTELDVADNFAHLRQMRRLTPGRQVPVIAAPGGVVVGFDPEALDRLLTGG